MKNTSSFWTAFGDLMTMLFFVMLASFAITVMKLKSTISLQKEKLSIIETVENNLNPLKKDTTLFIYQPDYKRFKLGFDVKFYSNKYGIDSRSIVNYSNTRRNIDKAGRKLYNIIEDLHRLKESDLRKTKNSNKESKLANLSYIVVIAGYASKIGEEQHNYRLSYDRAYSLWKYWKNKGIDFEDPKFEGLIDLQISGNGFGGIGREPIEINNQRFIIQINPKIGDF